MDILRRNKIIINGRYEWFKLMAKVIISTMDSSRLTGAVVTGDYNWAGPEEEYYTN